MLQYDTLRNFLNSDTELTPEINIIACIKVYKYYGYIVSNQIELKNKFL